MYMFKRMSRYILNEVETSRHLILIRLYFILTILITEDDHMSSMAQQPSDNNISSYQLNI
jgi:hypothetical protein